MTKAAGFNIANSHPTLTWLNRINKGTSVPADVAKELSNLIKPTQAQEFIASICPISSNRSNSS